MDKERLKTYVALCSLMSFVCVMAGHTSRNTNDVQELNLERGPLSDEEPASSSNSLLSDSSSAFKHPAQRVIFSKNIAARLRGLGCLISGRRKKINCENVRIEEMGFRLPASIKEFVFVNGGLRYIDSWRFANLSSMSKIQLDRNPLGPSLRQPVSPFLGCVSLEILIMSGCQITVIHPDFFKGVVMLRKLNLGHNHIQSPGADWNLPSSISHIELQHNEIQTVTKSWNISRYQLHTLFLHFNNITYIEKGSINLPVLRNLYLQHNNLITLPRLIQMKLVGRRKPISSLHHNPWQCDCRLIYLMAHVWAKKDQKFTCANYQDEPAVVLGDPKNMKCDLAGISCNGTKECPLRCRYNLQIPLKGGKCGCIPGTKNVKGGCQYCKAGRYQPKANRNSCLDCGEGKIKDMEVPSILCSCKPGYFTNSQGRCEACRPGTFKDFAGIAICSPCTEKTKDKSCVKFFSQKKPQPTEVTTDEKPIAAFPYENLSVVDLLKKKQQVLMEKKAAASLLHSLSATLMDVDFAIARKIETMARKKYQG